MQYLRTNTATRITVGPFLDKTDGVTPETALTVTNEKLTFVVDDSGVPTLVLDTAPTASGGNNDMVHITGDDSGYYDLELTAANVNYLGRAKLALTDAANHCPVFHEFMIIPAVVYDAMILGTDLFDVSVTQWTGTTVATPDTAGYVKATLKSGTGTGEVNLSSGAVPIQSGTGTGQLDVTSGVVKANVVQMLATAFTESGAGRLVAGFKKFFDVVTPASTMELVTAVTTVTTLTNAPSDSSGVTTLLSRLSATRAGYLDNLSGGAVALASKLTKYVQLLARKDSAIATDNSAEVTEINANGGSGGGAYANTTDAQEALRDRGDAAWITATGFSTLDAAGVRSAVGLASANLDTQLATIDDFLDTEIAAIKTQTDKMVFTVANQLDVNVIDWKGATAPAMTGDAFARLGAPAGASVSADVAAVKAQTAAIETDTGTDIPALINGLNDLSATDVENAVWDADITTHSDADSAGEALQNAGAAGTPPTANEIADQVWDEILSGHAVSGSTGEALGAAGGAGDPWITALPGAYSAGQAGYIVGTNLNATVSSRASQTSLDTLDDYVDTEVAAIKAKTDQLTFTVANQVDANALRIEGVDATNQIRDSVLSDATRFAGANIDAAISSRSTLDGSGVQSAMTAQGYTSTRAGYLDTLNGLVQAIWDKATSALTSVGSIGKLLVDNVNATISSRSSHSAADVWAVATRLLTAGTNIVLAKGTGITGFNDLSAAQVNAEADTALADYDAPTSAELVSEINSVQADIAALNNLSSAQAQTAAAAALTAYDPPTYAELSSAIDGVPTATENADELLKRDLAAVTGEAARSLLNVARLLRNKVVISGGVLTVYKEDDTTVAWTAAVGSDGSADPIVSVDP